MSEYPILQGAEPFYFDGNDVGVLMIHGFTGTTQSMRYLGETIAESGYTVYGPLLTGHGTDPQDMETRSCSDWMTDVEKAYEKLRSTCSTVFVAGLSMGGTLTLYLAEKYPEIAGIMPINAAIELQGMETYYEDIRHKGEKFVAGIGSDIKKENVTELVYAKTPVRSMGELVKLMKQVRKALASVQAPILIFSSTVDHVVPPENSQDIFDMISSTNKKIIPLENS